MPFVEEALQTLYFDGESPIERNKICAQQGWHYDELTKGVVQAKRPFDFPGLFYAVPISWIEYRPATERQAEKWVLKEPELCAQLQKQMHLHFINGRFINENGTMTDESILAQIAKRLKSFFDTGIARMAENVLKLMRSTCYCPAPDPAQNLVFLQNGITIEFDKSGNMGMYTDPDAITLNRLPIIYDPEAKCPTFERYMSDLYTPEDTATILQFMGYCLIPSTKAQKALMIRGQGENGKSTLIHVLQKILGASCTIGRLPDLQENRFKLATLQNRLLFCDDDLQTAQLKETSLIKTIITATVKMQAERKGKDTFEFQPYARLLCVGNSHISAANDHSQGFYRRLILLECKPRPATWKKDVYLEDAIINNELPGVLNWMLKGLSDLIAKRFQFTISNDALNRVEEMKREDNPTKEFLQTSEWIALDPEGLAPTQDIIKALRAWAKLNAIQLPSDRTITNEIAAFASDHKDTVSKTYHILSDESKTHKRGYKGIALTPLAMQTIHRGNTISFSTTSQQNNA